MKIIINNAIFIQDSPKKDFDKKYWYMAAWKMDKCLFLFVNFFFATVPSHLTGAIWFYKLPVVNSAHDPLGHIYIYIFAIANIPVQIGYLTKVLHTSS